MASSCSMDVEGISFVTLGQKDIVRHRLVTRIVDAYDQADRTRKEEWRKSHPVLIPNEDN